jgi:hypothetical protein
MSAEQYKELPQRWFEVLPVGNKAAINALIAGPARLAQAIEAGEDVAGVRWERHMCLELLHVQYERASPELTNQQIRRLWEGRVPFVLYLRTYSFGSRLLGTGHSYRTGGETQVVSNTSMKDLRMRSALRDAVGELPIVSVVNPIDIAFEATEIRYHEEEWRARVGDLIRAASLIIIYVGGVTAGLHEEFEIIQSAGRQPSTLVITGHAERAMDDIGAEVLGIKWKEKRPALTPPAEFDLPGFRHVLTEEAPAFKELLRDKVVELFDRQGGQELSPEPPVPTILFLSEQERNAIIEVGRTALAEAQELGYNGRFLVAEAYFHRALGFFFGLHETRVRVGAYLELGRLYLRSGQNMDLAARTLQWATDLYRRLGLPRMLLSAAQECATACMLCDPPELERARAALEEATGLLPASQEKVPGDS